MAQVIAYPFNMIQKQKLDYRTGKITSEPVGSWGSFLQNSLICAGIATRWLVVCAVVLVVGYGTIYAYNANLETTLKPVQIEKVEEEKKDTHFVVSYYVDGQRYVRTINTKTAELLTGTAKDFGINPAHLIAMAIQEGSVPNPDGNYYGCDSTAVGDGGRAVGMFQIHYKLHNLKRTDAMHPYFSARWTCERLIAHGYKHNPTWAIQTHNRRDSRMPYGKRIMQIARTLKPITK